MKKSGALKMVRGKALDQFFNSAKYTLKLSQKTKDFYVKQVINNSGDCIGIIMTLYEGNEFPRKSIGIFVSEVLT